MGRPFFFDGGSSSVSGAGTYRILPFLKAKGVKKIDYWLISHTDLDHISGLEEILKTDYPIGTLVFARYGWQDEAGEKLRQMAAHRRTKTKIGFLSAGEGIKTGEDRLICLFPTVDYPVADANSGSLVILYETAGFRGLFTGDISEAEEQWLTEHRNLPHVTFYKAAHHGSNFSNSEEFLKKLAPDVCAISCGEKNRYGHPGKDALRRIKQYARSVAVTAKSGRIRVTAGKNGWTVQNYANPLEETICPVLE